MRQPRSFSVSRARPLFTDTKSGDCRLGKHEGQRGSMKYSSAVSSSRRKSRKVRGCRTLREPVRRLLEEVGAGAAVPAAGRRAIEPAAPRPRVAGSLLRALERAEEDYELPPQLGAEAEVQREAPRATRGGPARRPPPTAAASRPDFTAWGSCAMGGADRPAAVQAAAHRERAAERRRAQQGVCGIQLRSSCTHARTRARSSKTGQGRADP